MASPTKFGGKQDTPFNEDRRQRFLDFLANAYSLSGAARAVGVHPDTVYDHRRSNPAFAAAVEEAIKRRGDFWEDQLRSLGARSKPDTLAVIVGLKKEGRFVDARDQAALARIQVNIQVNNNRLEQRYSAEELEAMLEAVQEHKRLTSDESATAIAHERLIAEHLGSDESPSLETEDSGST